MRLRAWLGLGLAAGAGACGAGAASSDGRANDVLVARELEFRDEYLAAPLTVRGRVLSRAGAPLAGARVELATEETISDETGRFIFQAASRKNALLVVALAGHRTERVPVQLNQPLGVNELELSPVLPFPDGDVRMTFGGDVQLGRRFLDTDESTPADQVPPDDPDALIRTSDPEPGTREVLRHVRSLLSDADFTSINLETVVTDTPETPDLDKSFVFFTLPGSLPALSWAGIDYVALGNNHIYDYFDDGLRDTLLSLDAHGVPHSGAGLDATRAFEAHRQRAGAYDYAFLSFVSIEGIPFRNATGATDERSGAADLNDDARITAALQRERDAGFIPVAQLHTGYEYTEWPIDDYTRERMEFVAGAGAALVVAHHPHVPQGFHFHDGTLIAHSLGNLAFDQERIETLFGMLLSVDLRGSELLNAEALPVFIEDFVPKPMAGAARDHFLRRIAASSHAYGTLVVPHAGSAWVVPAERAAEVASVERELRLSLGIDSNGFGVVDLRPELAEGEAVARVTAPFATRLRIGRDIVVFGDMEDVDVDDDQLDTSVWYTTGLDRAISSFACRENAYRGAVALCSIRQASSTTDATVSIRSRVRVLGDKLNLPNKELTLLAYVSAEDAGPVRAEVKYQASIGDKEFGSQLAFRLPAGSYDWQPRVADLAMPPDSPDYPRDPDDPYDPLLRNENARAFRVFFHHSAPPRGAGIFRVDDVAVISWEEELEPRGETELPTPHPRDFLRIEAPAGDYELTVTVRKLVPRAALAD